MKFQVLDKTNDDAFAFASIAIKHLDTLWFQVSGTLCNLTCNHCFISCSPKNDSFGFMSLATIEPYLQQAAELGVKEFYFTGGEPFLNKEMVAILLRTLDFGPATILTNGTVLKDAWLEQLSAKLKTIAYGLEFRVSIDGYDSQTNDQIRGLGTFERALKGVGKLVEFGFLPIVTVTRFWEEEDDQTIIEKFKSALATVGCLQPRLKIMPTLKIGAQVQRGGGYMDQERVEPWMLESVGHEHFVCSNSRIVSERGVHVCPILLESKDSVLGDRLSQSLVPFELRHGACYTCYQYGAICSNSISKSRESQ